MQGRGEKEKEREREIAVRRLVTRLAKVVSRTREKAVNDSTEGYLALFAARLDQQEAAQPVVTYPGISFYSPRMKRIRNTRNFTNLCTRFNYTGIENGSIRAAVRENRKRRRRRKSEEESKKIIKSDRSV